ncbi:dj-1 family protein [Apiospora rasikravindrae]|uniref:Dj-1 family protein n=1 Tax=Apiospora rasikravindrae TaxID=990691 RepID=A0ABR1TZ63_9PEZI
MHTDQLPGKSKPAKNIGVVLFPSFDVVNIFGDLEPLNLLSLARQLNLYMIAATRDPVSTAPRAMNTFNSSFGEVIVPSHTFDSVIQDQNLDLDMLLIPGGISTRAPDLNNTIQFVSDVFPRLQDGRRAWR